MTQDKSSSNFFQNNDFFKAFENFGKFPFDVSSLIETQRRNLQTFSEAQQIAFQSLQTIATRQAELLSQIMKEQSSLTSELLKEGKPEDKLARNAELFKKSYEKTLAGMNEISELLQKTNADASSVINRRLSASLKEIKAAIDKTSPEDGKKAA
ncbi:MAG: phasin family protein [Rhodospirillales bacterium]|nr:phasin family protein [Alphaproteobacteria bacterium]MCB1839391.1 phasin family protein [Alphaproteobacteria bacterium]MCB9976060.1 phasin family protein [Rhodospirillales bacterium]